MPLIINLRHLEDDSLELSGELPVTALDLDLRDDMVQATQPLAYDLEVELLDEGLLVQGSLQMTLDCRCVRCLKEFKHELDLDPWTVHLPLAGEDAVSIKSDCVDLTPWVREDILLGFPQHPLCKPGCCGLPQAKAGPARKTVGQEESKPSAWAELNKLKL